MQGCGQRRFGASWPTKRSRRSFASTGGSSTARSLGNLFSAEGARPGRRRHGSTGACWTEWTLSCRGSRTRPCIWTLPLGGSWGPALPLPQTPQRSLSRPLQASLAVGIFGRPWSRTSRCRVGRSPPGVGRPLAGLRAAPLQLAEHDPAQRGAGQGQPPQPILGSSFGAACQSPAACRPAASSWHGACGRSLSGAGGPLHRGQEGGGGPGPPAPHPRRPSEQCALEDPPPRGAG